jgi:bis(5'-nucleosyl)-tetraphosphatase (symmetrical)
MAVYAIGDVQGCYDSLQRLVECLRFDPSQDTLWFTGDLVNRGPQSLLVLRLVHSLGERAVTVLGNHDLTLLAVAEGYRQPKRSDTFQAILTAPDRESLLAWLRQRPLLHHDRVLGFTLVHAGLAPSWDWQQAIACAAELEAVLSGADYRAFLAGMFGSEPRLWHEDLQGIERLRCSVNCFTRLRYCHADGALNFSEKGPPGSQPEYLWPWFRVPGRRHADLNIIFGHWATLGYYREPGIIALDSGCVWGGRLTAVRLDAPGQPVYAVECGELQRA